MNDYNGRLLIEDLARRNDTTVFHKLAQNIPDEYRSCKVDTFSIDTNGKIHIQLEKPVEMINFNMDVEYILRSEKRMYDWLNLQGTIESSENQKQKMLTFLQSLDDNDQAIVKFLCAVYVCDKNLLDGGDINV